MTARRRTIAIATAGVVALLASACKTGQPEPCTQAELDQPALSGMPVPTPVTQTRRLNGDRLDALPAGVMPSVTAEHAWTRLRAVRQSGGGGRDELLLGLFSGRGYSKVPAWVLFTSHIAEQLDPLPLPPGVKPRDDASPCAFVDVLTVLDARTGELFYGSTVTSGGRRSREGPLPGRSRTTPEPEA